MKQKSGNQNVDRWHQQWPTYSGGVKFANNWWQEDNILFFVCQIYVRPYLKYYRRCKMKKTKKSNFSNQVSSFLTPLKAFGNDVSDALASSIHRAILRLLSCHAPLCKTQRYSVRIFAQSCCVRLWAGYLNDKIHWKSVSMVECIPVLLLNLVCKPINLFIIRCHIWVNAAV